MGFLWAAVAFLFSQAVMAAPTKFNYLSKRSVTGPVIASNFPDPSAIKVGNTYYAFSTTSDGLNVPVATSPDFNVWTVEAKKDALPLNSKPSWMDPNPGIWAPDVQQLPSGGFAMTFSAASAQDNTKHCVGVAISSSVTGPYALVNDDVFACPLSDGGAIDSSFFLDTDGKLYIVYKVDGNSVGKSTPIMIQQVEADGFTKIGQPTQLLTNGPYDGGITEAPSMLKVAGMYILTFSSNLYSTDYYDISYATSSSPTAPFTKSSAPLLVTGNYGLGAPGGATLLDPGDGVKMVFHANIGGPDHNDAPRGMWTAGVTVDTNARTISV